MGVVESFMAGVVICTLLAGYIAFAATAEDNNDASAEAGHPEK